LKWRYLFGRAYANAKKIEVEDVEIMGGRIQKKVSVLGQLDCQLHFEFTTQNLDAV
jgi:hypothetical protein